MSALEDWISAHHVCWDVVPTRPRNEGGHPGFELTLLALCGAGHGVDPVPSEGHAAHERLANIVARVIPRGQPFHVEAYDASVHLRAESGFAAEVELVAELFPDPAEAARVRSAVEAGLRGLGIRAKSWRAELVGR